MRRNKGRILDEYLVACARDGDQRAFTQLVERWQGKLLAHAFRLAGDREVARDAVQDAWTDIARSLRKLRDTAAFPAWAYRIVTRRVADHIRKAQKRRALATEIQEQPVDDTIMVDSIESNADGIPLKQAIATLPQGQRAVIALFYTEELSVAEISAVLSVPAGTVKTRLMNARRKLRQVLEGGNPNDRY